MTTRRFRAFRARAWLALLAGFAMLGSVAPAHAHALSTASVDIVRGADDAVRVEIDLSIRDLALTVPLDADRDERVTWGELRAQRAALFALVGRDFALATGAACTLAPAALGVRRYDDGAYAALQLAGRCATPGALRVRYDLLFDRDAQHRAVVTVDDRGVAATALLGNEARTATLGSDARSPLPAFVREGVGHILSGVDHLAFLFCLLLPATLVRVGGGWEPAAGLGASLRRVAGIVTAFTLAHSITLSLAALGWVTPASRWVESAIAASVVLAALNNLRPVVAHRGWAIGFTFGLVHGFGFAGALGQLGLPEGARLASLVGFNAGVELGQLGVVAAVVPVLYSLRRRPVYARWLMPAASLAIAGVAGVWLWQRALG